MATKATATTAAIKARALNMMGRCYGPVTHMGRPIDRCVALNLLAGAGVVVPILVRDPDRHER
jgi:hypothetical protein